MNAAGCPRSQGRGSRAEDDATPDQVAAEILIIGHDPDRASTDVTREAVADDPQPLGRFRSRDRARLVAACTALAAAGAVIAGLAIVACSSGSELRRCPHPDSAQADLRQMTEAENKALVAADTASLDALLADDFTLVTPDGDLLSRADLITSVGSGDLDFRAIHIVDTAPQDAFAVRFDCTTATVTYRSDLDVSTTLVHYRHDARQTNIWTRTGSGWKQIQAHTTAVGGFPPASQ